MSFTGTPVVRPFNSRCMLSSLMIHSVAVLGVEHYLRRERQWQRRLWRHRMEQGILWPDLRRAGWRGVRYEVGRSRHRRLCVCPSPLDTDIAQPRLRLGSFYRAAVPADVLEGNPTPSTWGEPVAMLDPSGCDPITNFVNHSIVFGVHRPSAFSSPCSRLIESFFS